MHESVIRSLKNPNCEICDKREASVFSCYMPRTEQILNICKTCHTREVKKAGRGRLNEPDATF